MRYSYEKKEGRLWFRTETDIIERRTNTITVGEKTLPTLIQTNETKKSTQIDAFFESKPKIDAFLKIDANAKGRNTKWHPDTRDSESRMPFMSVRLISGGCALFTMAIDVNL